MAYVSPFLRIVASGSLVQGGEAFSFGLSVLPSFNEPPYDEPTAVPAALVTAFETFFDSSLFSQAATLTMLKVNLIGTDGRYVNQETVLHEFDPPVVGNATTIFPPQVALAATLTTAKNRGLACRGRIFLPMPASALSADGRLSTAQAVAYANHVATLIHAVNSWSSEWRVGVASAVGAGDFEFVTGVEVGRVYDTIRSRRRSLDEDRQVAVTSVVPT